MRPIRSAFVASVIASAALVACSPSPSSPPPTAAAPPQTATAAPQGEKELALYRQLIEQKSWELAVPIGREIVAKYPASEAAREVQASLEDAAAKAEALTTKRRLEALWSYQSGKESGGTQNTASIYSSDVAASERVRLILRRHSAWGQSAYLFGSGKGFECKGVCNLDASFDGKPARIAAYLPDTGEPALFLKDDKGFIAKMAAATTFTVKVIERGKGARTLKFEVGGYDAAKFPPLAAKKK